MLGLTARVCRDSQVKVVPARTLVPGDLVLLEAGDRIPADGRRARRGSRWTAWRLALVSDIAVAACTLVGPCPGNGLLPWRRLSCRYPGRRL
ncbi:hypothetical protein [Streptomyces sp. NPDC094149]|uniref:P-type ATPase n=1 Tax=Streptomyces sp. NPDC094149 TaxID=3155079 RepID=UPI0033262D55